MARSAHQMHDYCAHYVNGLPTFFFVGGNISLLAGQQIGGYQNGQGSNALFYRLSMFSPATKEGAGGGMGGGGDKAVLIRHRSSLGNKAP